MRYLTHSNDAISPIDLAVRPEVRAGNQVRGELCAPRPPARICWPTADLEFLHAQIDAWGLPLDVRVRSERPVPGASSPSGVVYFHADEYEAPATAYALSTGRVAERVSPRRRGEIPGGGSSLLVTDLVDTPFGALDAAGCIPWTEGFRGTAILPTDARHVRGAMLLKSLLARHGLLPAYGRRIYVNALATTPLVAEDSGESFLFGSVPADVLRARLSSRVEHMILLSHSNPFDSLLGEIVLCAMAGMEVRDGDPSEPLAVRGLPCLSGGVCIRADQSRAQRGIDVTAFMAPSELAARHLIWLGCDVLAYRESVLVGRQSMAAQLFAGPHLVTLIAPVQNEFPTVEHLLHLGFLLDEPVTAGELFEEHGRFVETSSARPGGYLLVGDPDLRVGDADRRARVCRHSHASVEGNITAVPPALRWEIIAAEHDAPPAGCAAPLAEMEVPGVVFGYADERRNGTRQLRLFAATTGGEVPGRVTLRPRCEAEQHARALQTLLARAAFWRALLGQMKSRLGRGGDGRQPLAADIDSVLADLGSYESQVAAVLPSLTPRRQRIRSDPRGSVQALRGASGALGVRLLSVVQTVATTINPKIFSRWLPYHEPAGDPHASEFFCGCGSRCDEYPFRCAVGGLERRTLMCPRCGTVADTELNAAPLSLAFAPREAWAEQPIRGVLSGLPGHPEGLVLSASLAPVQGTDATLTLQALRERPTPADTYDVEFSFDPARPRASQQVYLFACRELAFQMACAWTQLGAEAAVHGPAVVQARPQEALAT